VQPPGCLEEAARSPAGGFFIAKNPEKPQNRGQTTVLKSPGSDHGFDQKNGNSADESRAWRFLARCFKVPPRGF
jgi:hypothetical protein